MLVYVGIAAVALWYWFSRRNGIPKGPAFLMFYSPRCGYCHEAMPEFVRLGTSTNVHNTTVEIARINVDEEREVAQEFGVEGLPTFVYTDGAGKVVKYEGDRKADAFKAFLLQVV